MFFKCHDSKAPCKEGAATACVHSLQSPQQGLRLGVSRMCSVLCCKHDMKEVKSHITRLVHLLKRAGGRAQASNAFMFAVAQDTASISDIASVHDGRTRYTANTTLSSYHHTACCPQQFLYCWYQGQGLTAWAEVPVLGMRQLLAAN